jgi:hypothetical protein
MSVTENVEVTVTVEGFGSKNGLLDQIDRVDHGTRPYHVRFEDGQAGWFDQTQIVITQAPPAHVVRPVDPFVAAIDAVLKAKPNQIGNARTPLSLPRLNDADDSSESETRGSEGWVDERDDLMD